MDSPAYALSPAMVDIAAERERQMAVEGIMPAHDDTHTGAELASGAMAYLDYHVRRVAGQTPVVALQNASVLWPWDDDNFFKPTEDLRRNLVKAAAMVIAEIERGDRAKGHAIALVPRRPAEVRHA